MALCPVPSTTIGSEPVMQQNAAAPDRRGAAWSAGAAPGYSAAPVGRLFLSSAGALRRPQDTMPTPPVQFLPARAKLWIASLDDPSLEIRAQYNPKELQIDKQINWGDHKAKDNRAGQGRQDA